MPENNIYPSVTALFENGSVKRVDSSERLSMLNMLIKNRCQYTIMHQHYADTLIKSDTFKDIQIYRSPLASNVVYMAIFLRPELKDIKQYFDVTVLIMESDGKLDASILCHLHNSPPP